jgi:hypothetical protein
MRLRGQEGSWPRAWSTVWEVRRTKHQLLVGDSVACSQGCFQGSGRDHPGKKDLGILACEERLIAVEGACQLWRELDEEGGSRVGRMDTSCSAWHERVRSIRAPCPE